MKRYSRTWFLVVTLKAVALIGMALSLIGLLQSRFLFTVRDLPSVLISFAHQFLVLWALAEGIRMIANTEAYARGVYSLTRKRTVDPVKAERPSAPVFEMRDATSDDLQFSPPERYRRQQLRMQGAPTRRVTVFRNRSDNTTHEPLPSGATRVVDSLDGNVNQHIPFDPLA